MYKKKSSWFKMNACIKCHNMMFCRLLKINCNLSIYLDNFTVKISNNYNFIVVKLYLNEKHYQLSLEMDVNFILYIKNVDDNCKQSLIIAKRSYQNFPASLVEKNFQVPEIEPSIQMRRYKDFC
jgi:hypothetical protein